MLFYGMVYLTLRLSDDDTEMLNSAVMYARTNSIVDLAVFEVSKIGQRHIHMLYEPINVTKSAWVQGFHKFFKKRWSGNKSYSCTELIKDKENFTIYCCKGTRFKPPDVIFSMIDPVTIDAHWKKYWSDKPIEKDNTLKSSSTKKKSDLTWSQNLTKTLEESSDHKWSYDSVSMDKILDATMVALGAGSKKLNSYIVRDIALGQLNALTKGQCKPLADKVRFEAFPDLFGQSGFAN